MYAHYTWVAFQELPPDERAKTIAHFRLHNLIEAHQTNEAMRPRSTD